MRKLRTWLLIAGLAIAVAVGLPTLMRLPVANGAAFTLPAACTATTGAIISAANWNTCLSAVATAINNIDNSRVAAGAGIVGSKLDLTSGTGRIVNDGGTVTTNLPALSTIATWSNAAITFQGDLANFTDTASAAASTILERQIGGAARLLCTKAGVCSFGTASASTGGLTLYHASSALGTTLQAGNATAAVTYTLPTADGASTTILSTNGSAVLSWASPLPKGYLWGLTLSNNGNDKLDIAVGSASDNSLGTTMTLAAALTAKDVTTAWAVGSTAGCLDTGAVANTTYHLWLIQRTDTGVVDGLCSTSASAPTMPASYTVKRRIGSIVRSGGVNVGFIQSGRRFDLKVPINSYDATGPGTSAVTVTSNVPTGVSFEAIMGLGMNTGAGGGVSILVTALDTTDTVPSATLNNARAATSAANGGEVTVRTNTSSQFRYRSDFSDGSVVIRFTTIGWYDTAGRDS